MTRLTTNLFRTQFKITKEWTILSKNTAKSKEWIDQCKKLQFTIKTSPFSIPTDIKTNLFKTSLLWSINQASILLKIQKKEYRKW